MIDFPFISSILLTLLFAGIICILFWNQVNIQKGIAIAFTTLYLILAILLISQVYHSGIRVVQIGNWPAPFGITLVADMLGALMILITAIISFAILWYSLQDIDAERKSSGYFPVFFLMLFGVSGAFLTGDVFNLYVWFEVMLVGSFVLMALGNNKAQLEGAVKYVVLNFIGSGFFLLGIGVLYKLTGTLNMADLAVIINDHPDHSLLNIAALFFFMAFGIKAAVFPLFFWLPASYHTPPISISGLMAGLLTKVGVYAYIRFFTLIFVHDIHFTHTLLLIVSGLTMIVGVLGAIAQNDFRKVLSFHIISQIGYMIMGLALFTPLAIAGSIFYVIHHILVKTNLFLISGIVKVTNGHFLLKKLGGVYDKFPLIAFLFVIAAFSLAGIPPLSGFWGKFILAKAGLQTQQYLIVFISLLVGLLTLFSMSKIWQEVFWTKNPSDQENNISGKLAMRKLFKSHYLLVLPSIFLALITLFISFFPQTLLTFSQMAVEQLLNSDAYIKAVLNQ
ncbi:MAG: Na+/H+ antiporter subunit D [Candidatus Cyclobacteriaceae bacterium M3_2C_046]